MFFCNEFSKWPNLSFGCETVLLETAGGTSVPPSDSETQSSVIHRYSCTGIRLLSTSRTLDKGSVVWTWLCHFDVVWLVRLLQWNLADSRLNAMRKHLAFVFFWSLWKQREAPAILNSYQYIRDHQSEYSMQSSICVHLHKWTLYAFLRQVSARLREALPLKRSRAGGKDTFSQAVPCRDMSTLSMTAAVWPWQCWTAVFESECQVVVKPNMSEWSLKIITNRT